MFGKNKISQSMIDAVNSVVEGTVEEKKEEIQELHMLEEASEKVPTPTGMKVYGSSYGNSKKARQDQTKSSVDTLKGPKDKEVKEELKGDQHKIDANKNDKIDAQDFKILRGKKKVAEEQEMTFAKKLVEKVKCKMQEKKDVVMPEEVRKSDVPAYLRKAKGDAPLTVADVKGPKKDTISAPENLAKARNEEVELNEMDDYPHPESKEGKALAKSWDRSAKKHPTDLKAPSKWKPAKQTINDIQKMLNKEDVSEYELDEMLNEVLGKDASAGDWINDFVHSDNPKFAGKSKAERKKMALGAYYGKQNEATIAGTPGWKEMKKDVKDKSGAVHTPMSRAKDLARSAFKKVQDKTKITK